MKHYSLTVKQYGEDGHITDKQFVDFTPLDCMYEGVVLKKASSNKRIIFRTFNTLVETCIEATYDEECYRWEVQGCESDTESGKMRYITFWGVAANEDEVYTELNGNAVECGSKYDEFFDSWLY